MSTLAPGSPCPVPTPIPSSPLLGPSSFSPLGPDSLAGGGPSRPPRAHRSPSQIRRSSLHSTSPPEDSLLLSTTQSYEPQPSPTSSSTELSSFADRTGMLGVAWGSRRGSDTQLDLPQPEDLQRSGRSSRSPSPRLGDSLVLGSSEPGKSSPQSSPRLGGQSSPFEDAGELRRPVKAWTLGQRSESCDSSATEVSRSPVFLFFLRLPGGESVCPD